MNTVVPVRPPMDGQRARQVSPTTIAASHRLTGRPSRMASGTPPLSQDESGRQEEKIAEKRENNPEAREQPEGDQPAPP